MRSPSDRRTRLIPFSGFARPSEGTLPPIIRFVLSLSQVEFSTPGRDRALCALRLRGLVAARFCQEMRKVGRGSTNGRYSLTGARGRATSTRGRSANLCLCRAL